MNLLAKARAATGEAMKLIPDNVRPVWHLTPDVGWTNDPNGFSTYEGKIHLFYQMNPYDIHWGPMYWGHAVTTDLFHWERQPIALAPDGAGEDGCFSGTAITENGKHILLYTSHTEAKEGRPQREAQSLADGDGTNYQKDPENPVITPEMLPEEFKGTSDFRDPMLWKEEDTFYCAVAARRTTDGYGSIVLFSSDDLHRWKYEGQIYRNEKGMGGRMLECPNLFRAGDVPVLICSAMEVNENSWTKDAHVSFWCIGRTKKVQTAFQDAERVPIDEGPDFYAPETATLPDGRVILIGWLQDWNNYMTPQQFRWSGMMTMPREVSLENGHLMQRPAREWESMARNKRSYTIELSEDKQDYSDPGISGRSFVLDMKVEEEASFTLRFAEDSEYHTDLVVDKKHDSVILDRTHTGNPGDRHLITSVKIKDLHRLELFSDRYSAEIFLNDGEKVLSSLIFTRQTADGISLHQNAGAVRLDLTLQDLEA